MGLVSPAGKNKYGHLLYGEPEQERIRLIRFYQQLGFPLKEIGRLLGAPASVKRPIIQEKVKMLETEHDRLQELIRQAKKYIAAL